MTPEQEVASLTLEESLQKVKDYRKTSKDLVGTLYPNVLLQQAQRFLEVAVRKWPDFMDHVSKDRHAEILRGP